MIGSSRSILTVEHEGAGDVVERRYPLHLTWFSCASRCAFRRIDAFSITFRQLGGTRLYQVHPFHVEAQPGGGGVVADRPEGDPLGNDGDAEKE